MRLKDKIRSYFLINYDLFFFVSYCILTSFICFKHFFTFSYDIDEYFSISFFKNIQLDSRIINSDLGNPPFFYILVKLYIFFFGSNETVTRILPFIFFIFSYIVFYKLLKMLSFKVYDRSILSLLYLGMNQFIYLRFYLRAYSLLLFLCLITVYLTFKLIKIIERNENLYSITFVSFCLFLLQLMGIFTHYLYIFFNTCWMVSLVSILLMKRKVKKNKIFFLKSLFNKKHLKPVFISYISSIFLSLIQLCNVLFREDKYDFVQRNYPWPNYSGWLVLLSKFNFWIYIPELINLCIFLFIFYLMIKSLRHSGLFECLILFYTLLSYAIYLLTDLHNYLSHAKYFVFLIPFFYLSLYLILKKIYYS